VLRDGLAFVHRGETVMPAGRGGNVIESHVTAVLDGEVVFRSVKKHAAIYKRANGPAF
jgi:hypothetical protein